MEDQSKTEQELIKEISDLKQRIKELEQPESGCKPAENSFRQEHELYLDLVNNQPAGIYRIRVFPREQWRKDAWINPEHPPYSVDLASNRFCELLGINRQVFETNPGIVEDLVYPEDKEDFCRRNEAANAEMVLFQWEGRLLIRGEILWVHFESIPRLIENGVVLWTGILYDITDRKRVEQSLRDSEALFKNAFASSPIGMALVSPNGQWLKVNPALCQIVGYSEKELLTKTFQDITHVDDLAADTAYVRQMLAGEISTYQMEKRYMHRQGQVVWVLLSVSLVRNMGGQPLFFISQILDVTERKRAEKVMGENEEKFRNLFNNTDIAMFRSRLDGSQLLDVNQKFLDLVGKTREQTLGKPSQILWVDQKEREKMMQRLIADGRVSQHEFQMLNEKKGVRDCITSLVLYREQGILEGSILDITERKNIEKALKESEERFRSAFEHAAIAFSLYSIDGHFIRVNQALCDMLGYSEEELKSKTFLDITHPDDLGSNVDQVNQLLSGKLPVVHFQKRYMHKRGQEVWASLSVSVVRDDNGAPMYLVSLIEDLTEKRKLEDQLRHAQKMEAVGTLAGGVAHDFNNILNVIIGFGTMVLDRIADDPVSKEQMQEVLAAADRAAELTKKLLIFSRKQVVEVKPVNINELILGLQKMLGRIIRENIDFKLELSGQPLMALADAGQIEQVLMNLAANARDAMPEGGCLTIGTGIKEIDEEYLAAYGFDKPGMYALITIADTGQGMDEETQKNIFEPFFTTKGIGEGTGLGLAISYGIIKQHDGNIKVYSELGKGTEFRIYLPLIEDSAVLEKTTEVCAAVKGGDETILLAEDDASLRKLSRIVLESYGYTVITAEDGEDAITKFMANREKISLALLDMIMPKKDGKEVSEAIRKVSPRIKVLFASGYTMDIIKTRELTESGFDFIHKPVKSQDLLRKVREILDK